MSNRRVSVSLQLLIGEYMSNADKAARGTDKIGDAATRAAQKQAHFQKATGAGMVTAAALGTAAIGRAVTSFMDFDTAMSAVGASADATGAQLAQLRAAALQAGADTSFSATEAAQAETELAKAGVSVSDVLSGGLKGALSLAAAGQLGVAEAAETAAAAMTQFGLSGRDVPHIADLLAAGAGKAQGSVHDLAGALNQSGLVAHQMGLSIEETTGVLAAFASAGMTGSDAGTSLKTALLRLGAPTAEAKGLMDRLGISAYDAAGQFVGMEGIAGQLHDRLGGLSEAQRNAALSTIFGSDAIRAASILYTQGAAGIDAWTGKVNDSGFAARQAAMLTDNLRGDLERLGGALSSALIGSGSGANSVLRDLTKSATGAVDIFTELPAPLQQTALGIGAVGTAAAAAGGGFLLLGPKVRAARAELAGMGSAGAAANRALGLTGRIAAAALPVLAVAGVAFGEYAKHAGEARQRVDELTDALVASKGAWDASTTAVVTHQLEQKGALQAAQLFGISLGDVTKAAIGNQDAVARVTTVLDAYYAATQEASLAGDVGTSISQDQAQAYHTLRDMLGGANSETRKAVEAARRQLEAQGEGTSATRTYTGSVREATGALTQFDTAAEAVKSSIDAINGVMISAAEADLNYRDAVAGATTSIRENGHTTDRNTTAGRANQRAVIAAIKAAEEHAAAVANQTGSVEQGNATFRAHVTQLRRVLAAAGLTKGQIDALVGAYGKVPPKAETKTSAPGAAAAANQLNAVATAANGIPRYVSVAVETIYKSIDLGGGRRARGVGMNAEGTPYWEGGLTWVGERGPELVDLPRGAAVFDAQASRQMVAADNRTLRPAAAAAGARGGGVTMQNYITVNPAPGMDEAALANRVAGRVSDLIGEQADLMFRAGT